MMDEEGSSQRRNYDNMTETGKTWMCEVDWKSPSIQEAEESKENILSKIFQEGHSPTDALVLATWHQHSDFWSPE